LVLLIIKHKKIKNILIIPVMLFVIGVLMEEYGLETLDKEVLKIKEMDSKKEILLQYKLIFNKV